MSLIVVLSSNNSASSVPGNTSELVLAKWTDRFIAWLIDFIIVNVVLWTVFAAASIPFWIDGRMNGWWPDDPWNAARWAVTSLVFLGYWIYFETTTGQSLGKLAMKLRTTDLSGNKADIRSVAIESFGKAFLLPVDVILGWIFTNDKRQRIFSSAARTVVIKVKEGANLDGGTRYTKD